MAQPNHFLHLCRAAILNKYHLEGPTCIVGDFLCAVWDRVCVCGMCQCGWVCGGRRGPGVGGSQDRVAKTASILLAFNLPLAHQCTRAASRTRLAALALNLLS